MLALCSIKTFSSSSSQTSGDSTKPGQGQSLDSFRDCLWSIDIPQESGAVMVFVDFDAFYQHWQTFAFELLDILEKQSRDFLLFGRRLTVLIQSNSPHISFQPVGARPIALNPEEQEIHLRKILKKNITS